MTVVVVVVSIIAWKMSVSAFRAASVNNGTAAAVFLTLALKGCSCQLIPVHPQYAQEVEIDMPNLTYIFSV